MLSRYFKKRKIAVRGEPIPLPWHRILPFLEWPERLVGERVCKQWKALLLQLKDNTQERMLRCFHMTWKTVRIQLPRYQSALIPHGQGVYQQLFSIHHFRKATNHVCGRAIVIPHEREGYKHTISGVMLRNTKCDADDGRCIELGALLRRYTKSGLSLLALPNEHNKYWSPLSLLLKINTIIHTRFPKVKMKSAGITHYVQPDLKEALLSFCCPCYIRYLCACGFFWPHTRNNFKVLEGCNV